MWTRLTKSLELLLLPWATAMSPSGILIAYTLRSPSTIGIGQAKTCRWKQLPMSYSFLNGYLVRVTADGVTVRRDPSRKIV